MYLFINYYLLLKILNHDVLLGNSQPRSGEDHISCTQAAVAKVPQYVVGLTTGLLFCNEWLAELEHIVPLMMICAQSGQQVQSI